MKRHKQYFTLLTILLSSTISAQHYTISGYVTDAAAEETMIGATIYDYDHAHGNGTVTNTYGNIGYLQINLLLFLQFMNK